ncbi:helix-turn-helix domain-containing protein [Candidatus Dojkabacteria bacterium]|nr:helix-turn-helix domain-containing protein [Candidatus Dojkabacteria bacterium]
MRKRAKLVEFKNLLETNKENTRIERHIKDERVRLASHVRKLREKRFMTTTELARSANVSYKSISKIENYKPVRFDTVLKVLKSLGIRITYSLD